ncbi:MAG TPA: IPTL-CTERM sorting domain-containing protein [Usitatibacter sp.]|nr:IPTL-CTERM sorting domain-containing protein [Usitatibacter sp.]
MSSKPVRIAFAVLLLAFGRAYAAGPLTLDKSFGAASIPLNATTTLTFVMSNPGNAHTNVGFTDNFPAGLVLADTTFTDNGACFGKSISGLAGDASISVTVATVPANALCSITMNVKGTSVGVKNNTTGPVSSTEDGVGGTASASLNVDAPPTVSTSFVLSPVRVTQAAGLQYSIANPASNPDTLTGVGFSDTLTAGIHVNDASQGLCGGTITLTSPSGIALSGASIAPGTSCDFTVTIRTDAAGHYTDTTSVTSTNGGSAIPSSASLDVEGPPSIAAVFAPSTIATGTTSALTFTVDNPAANPFALTGVGFTDTLPAGLSVASASATACGGTVTSTSPSGIALSGATIASGTQCQFTVTVTGTASGLYTNTTSTVGSSNGGAGNSASSSLTVASAPTVATSFGAASIPLNATTSLTLAITNPNAGVALTGVAFTETLPAGLVIATPAGVTDTCGGAVTATAGTALLSLSGGTLAASSGCTVTVNVQGTSAGTKNNAVSVSSNETGSGPTSNASIAVIAAPSLSMAFTPAIIAKNATSTLTFTITNPNGATVLAGVGFTDTLPAGLTVASGTSAACGGTLTTTAPSLIALSGASIPAGGQCQPGVTVTGAANGVYSNTTGVVGSTNGGSGNTATATLSVVSTSFTGSTPNGTATASFTGGGATCSYASAAFIPLTGGAGSPPSGSAPGGYEFLYGLFDFTVAGCTPGSALAFTITYPNALPPGSVYWKYGPTAANATPHWYRLPATISGSTASFTITDGGLGDDDLAANGGIVDQGGPGFPVAAAIAVPTLSEWALILLAGLMAAMGWCALRRRS